MFQEGAAGITSGWGGHGPGRPTVGRNSTWNKFAVAAVALITLVYLFGPREAPTVLEYLMYALAFPLQRVCSLNFFSPQASIDDYYDVITSPHDDSHHPTPPDNVGQVTDQEHPPPTKPDTNIDDNNVSTSKPPTSPADEDRSLDHTLQTEPSPRAIRADDRRRDRGLGHSYLQV